MPSDPMQDSIDGLRAAIEDLKSLREEAAARDAVHREEMQSLLKQNAKITEMIEARGPIHGLFARQLEDFKRRLGA